MSGFSSFSVLLSLLLFRLSLLILTSSTLLSFFPLFLTPKFFLLPCSQPPSPNWPPRPPPLGPSFEAGPDPSIQSLGARGRGQPRPRSRPHRRGAGWPALPRKTVDFCAPNSSAASSAGWFANSYPC